jgi:asparagine synthase (glutamine-hydrolysing)
MCGIAGLLHFDTERTVEASTLERMTSALAHRGPDGSGCYVAGNIGLGHRRLAIIDLSTGAQPMASPDNSLVVVFNGEIYNYVELKQELTSLGHQFHTSSDTEVIINAYRQWGVKCQEKFNGMWAFALWDVHEQLLFLSRDRIGEKPLYYSVRDGSLLFGSEIKSILASGQSYQAAWELTHLYLSLGYVPAPYTFYTGISKLRPGHFLIARRGQVREHAYWDLPAIGEGDMRRDSTKIHNEFDEYFADSVKIRMRSDVPFGAFLSGGLDSSSVVAAMSLESAGPVETFTVGFTQREFDERSLARLVAQQFHTNHHEQVAQPETFDESLQKISYHFDEPFGDASAVPVGLVSRLARQRVTMVLTGDGGDEVLSGYTSYLTEKMGEQYMKIPGVVRSGLSRSAGAVSALARNGLRYKLNRLRRFATLSESSFETRFISKLSMLDPQSIRRLIPESAQQISIEDYLQDVFRRCSFTSPFYRLMYFNLKVSLPDDMLAKVDRMSMAHSLEARVPFLDPRLIELTYGVHKDVKLPRFERKSVLRRTYGPRLPAPLLKAPKMPFSVPLREWFKDEGFDERLSRLVNRDFGLDKTALAGVVQANSTGRQDYGDFIWRLFVLQSWVFNS